MNISALNLGQTILGSARLHPMREMLNPLWASGRLLRPIGITSRPTARSGTPLDAQHLRKAWFEGRTAIVKDEYPPAPGNKQAL